MIQPRPNGLLSRVIGYVVQYLSVNRVVSLVFAVHPSVCPSVLQLVSLSVCSSVCLSVQLSVNLRHCSFNFSRKARPCGWWLANQFFLKSIRRQFGLDRCLEVHSAKGFLMDAMSEFFISFGILVLNIYGSSETSG